MHNLTYLLYAATNGISWYLHVYSVYRKRQKFGMTSFANLCKNQFGSKKLGQF